MMVKKAFASATDVFEFLEKSGPTYHGVIDKIENVDDKISFSAEGLGSDWIEIPVNMIEAIESYGPLRQKDRTLYYVKIKIKPPAHPEARVFSSLPPVQAAALSQFTRVVAPMGFAGGPGAWCKDAVTGQWIPCPPNNA